MKVGVLFTVFSIIYCAILIIVFFSKKRVNSIENKLFLVISIITLLELFSGFAITFVSNSYVELFNKLYYSVLIVWIILFTIYTITISYGNNENIKKLFVRIIPITIVCFILTVMIIFILPMDFVVTSDVMFSYGKSASFVYGISFVCILVMLICLISKIKVIIDKKYLPLLAFILLGSIAAIIQFNDPTLYVITPLKVIIIYIMYFTIENPDLKLINELNIAKEQAEKANNAKTEFLSNVSHEIRTPLNAIVGFSQTLMERELPSEARDEIKDILQASDNLLEIVNGILDISKIEANKLEIIEKEYESRQIFDELVSLTKARIGDKSLTFEVHIDELMPKFLYGDSTRLKQIVLNLLTNAVKYTKEGKICMMVSSVVKGDICRLIIAVEDTGIGIKPEKIDKLFTKFERLDVEKDITIEGTGLGLAITKKLVDLMHGQIVVSSTYGEGSKFTVAIDQKVATGENIKVKEPLKVQDFNNMKVLVVDDNKVNLKVANRMLAAFNVLVDEADSGEACLEKVKTNDYDLILLDIMMPHMSGVETLNHLKEMKVTSKVVALTADAISGMREKYLSDGFDGYLAKPIQKEELQNVLSKMYKEE